MRADRVFKTLLYFNPRSHERSDGVLCLIMSIWGISIHAPTRGATDFERAIEQACQISIHAPTRGATASACGSAIGSIISIHAPTRGATFYLFLNGCHSPDFNPRSHERSDKGFHFMLFVLCNFNPRSHERSDSNIAQKICLFLYNTDNKYIIR